jgi:hypothetical protein
MSLDYSQKRLLNMALKNGKGKRATLLSMKKRRSSFRPGLEVYAFWTGFASTLVSFAQVLIMAMKK